MYGSTHPPTGKNVFSVLFTSKIYIINCCSQPVARGRSALNHERGFKKERGEKKAKGDGRCGGFDP
jgi:hypothetical protein